MSSPANSVDRPDPGDAVPSGSVQSIACNGCRKAKLRCSRDRPTCANCTRIGHGCVYETKRVKPGIKAGAIENIHRRLDDLESRIADQHATSSQPQSVDLSGSVSPHAGDTAHGLLALLARELPKFVSASQTQAQTQAPLHETSGLNASKRRRVEQPETRSVAQQPAGEPPPLTAELTDLIVDVYFTHIHPWMPMLHQDRFRQRVDDPNERPLLQTVLHAMHITVAPYLDQRDTMDSEWPVDRLRRWVTMTALESISMESLQALIIVAFHEIGSGNASRAWSIVASLSRTVEYLQITIDPEEGESQPINRPFAYLPPPKDWADQEERRRVFWNVFLLDRFGSITMGWNTSLTSIDVHQRLPCDGILWRKQEAVTTPYMGIWDKSTGGIGNMSPGSARRHDGDPTAGDLDRRGSRAAPRAGEPDVSRIGAFAYCVEATESMSRVVTYFLQQRLDPHDPDEVTAWLARFKELDLRLVHWKMFLPQKWKSNVPIQDSSMDPNLTLAHVTHNASTILLHQLIAYPPLSWPFRNRLPSVWSADTCCLAGMEIATITKKYLENTPQSLPLASFFAFCLYIAARAMLIHWRHDTQNRQLDEFWSLTHSLEEMSRRWNGPSVAPEVQRRDISAKYAWKLRDLHRRCMHDRNFRIQVMDYTQEVDHRASFTPPQRVYDGGLGRSVSFPSQESAEARPLWHSTPAVTSTVAHDGSATAAEPQQAEQTTMSYQQYDLRETPMSVQGPPTAHASQGPDDLEVTRQMATNEFLMDMDRVITFNDGSLFTVDMGNGLW